MWRSSLLINLQFADQYFYFEAGVSLISKNTIYSWQFHKFSTINLSASMRCKRFHFCKIYTNTSVDSFHKEDVSLPEKCPYSEFFSSVFSHIRTEYGDIRSSTYIRFFSVRITLHKKIKFSIKDFFNNCDQIRNCLRMWYHLLKKSLMENFIFVQCQWVRNVSFSEHFVYELNGWSLTQHSNE